jgi:hypothetical protein
MSNPRRYHRYGLNARSKDGRRNCRWGACGFAPPKAFWQPATFARCLVLPVPSILRLHWLVHKTELRVL